MGSQKPYLMKIRKRLGQLGENMNEETFTGLLLIRQVSNNYKHLDNQLTIDDLMNGANLSQVTPWHLVAGNTDNGYSNAMAETMKLLGLKYAESQKFLDIEKYREVEESLVNECICLLSEISLSELPVSELYRDYIKTLSAKKYHKDVSLYTPKEIVQCISSLVPPEAESLYDPCCGSGDMLLQVARTMQTNKKLYGQTQDNRSYQMCHANALLQNINIDLGKLPANALTNDQYFERQFDFIIANPPFNQSNRHDKNFFYNDPLQQYGTSPYSSANFAWVQHILYHLKTNGQAVVILPNSTLTSTQADEHAIRKSIISKGVLEAVITFPSGMFYNTKIPFCVWILNKSRQNLKQILLIDATKLDPPIKKSLTPEQIEKILNIVFQFRTGKSLDATQEHIVVSLDEIAKKDYILSPNLYTFCNHIKPSDVEKNKPQLNAVISKLQNSVNDEKLLTYLEKWKQGGRDSSWKKESLLNLYSVLGGPQKEKKFFGKGTSLVDVKSIIQHFFIPNILNSRMVVSSCEREKYGIKTGDVLLNRTSETIDELACCCVAAKDSDAVYSTFVKRLRPRDENLIYPAYAAGYFRSAVYRREVEKVSTVYTTYASINNDKLMAISFYCPEKELQREIGDTLLTVSQYIECNENPALHKLLNDFTHLLIEQYITYPIACLWESGGLGT